jgi:hypothetical protein
MSFISPVAAAMRGADGKNPVFPHSIISIEPEFHHAPFIPQANHNNVENPHRE